MCQINTEEMKKQIGCIDVLSEFFFRNISTNLNAFQEAVLTKSGRVTSAHYVTPDRYLSFAGIDIPSQSGSEC